MRSKRHTKSGATVALAEYRRAAFRAGMSPTTPSYAAAMEVLVNGAQQVEVAGRYGVTRQTVSEAVIRVREVLLGGGVCPLCLHKMEGGESAA